MGGSPALPFLVPLEHREVSHPEGPEVSAHERTMLRSIFLSQSHAQQASSRVYRMVVLLDFGLHAAFRRMSTRLAVASNDHDQVVGVRTTFFADFGSWVGKRLFQSLEILKQLGITSAVKQWLDVVARSEEHTSELQSQFHLVCR